MKKLIIMLLVALVGTSSFATDQWKHARLMTQQRANISIDFKTDSYRPDGCYKCSEDTIATNTYINVFRSDLNKQSQVQLVLRNKEGNNMVEPQRIIDLKYITDGHFSIKLADLLIFRSGYGGTSHYNQELSVVINGDWQIDDMSNSTTFHLNLVNLTI